jgi:hypothetical protein
VIERFEQKLEGQTIRCAKVHLMTALYSSDWICDSHSSSDESFQLLFSGKARGFGDLPPDDL